MRKKFTQSLSTAFEYKPEGHSFTKNRLLIGTELGAKHFSLQHGTILPGGEACPHKHYFEQGIYIIRGKARISIEAEETFEVGQDTAVFFPPRRTHCIAAVGEEELKILIIYAPSPR
jgi:mannose-6-phosphate isomerase-like protein (cupin superfamily)